MQVTCENLSIHADAALAVAAMLLIDLLAAMRAWRIVVFRGHGASVTVTDWPTQNEVPSSVNVPTRLPPFTDNVVICL